MRRIQRQRTRGWRMPAQTVYVGRPSRWGNPYVVGRDGTAEECVEKFIADHEHDEAYLARLRRELGGKSLACWCPEDALYCHADVLLVWAQ
jgi:hypothetical protein